uniref:Splicing factor 45 n=1 Tax=Cacopsylla melanoneura TaxID=428564 RepID=A0A8D9A957_9HEMI
MSLYDDFEPLKQKTDQVAGWSSGIKLFQSQMQLKKAALGQPQRGSYKKSSSSVLAPVIDLKNQRNDDDKPPANFQPFQQIHRESSRFGPTHTGAITATLVPNAHSEMDWCFQGAEYDPMWPNDYEKAVRDLRDIKDREREKEDEERKKRREERNRKSDTSERRNHNDSSSSDSDSETTPSTPGSTNRKAGAAIAPPPSLQEKGGLLPHPTLPSPPSGPFIKDPKSFGASVAAKIMAKYGFREGQGLGKKEQGMSSALQVEKTSKRGGRIIHEKDIMPPPPPGAGPGSPSTPTNTGVDSPSHSLMPPPPPLGTMGPPPTPAPEPSITEIMKSPSKVVLLRNMVGPGEVDSDLEPEVKDECNTKYGDVIKVIIHELPNAPDDEMIRIFVEFKRIESAIKAVVDLNGRFFGGRQVKAGFYKLEKFNNLELLE